MKNLGIKKLWNIFIGAVIIHGYYLYESLLFGFGLWIIFNGAVAPYVGLPPMSFINAFGILFVIKILLFDASKIGGKSNL